VNIKEKTNYKINLENYDGLVDRDLIRKVTLDVAEVDEKVVVVGADALASGGGNYVKDRFPDRAFDFGIAEPNMITASAGLAKTGYIPVSFLYGFLVTRAAEQIKLDVCYNKNNVKIITSASAFDMHDGGVTHHGSDDISILRNFPNIAIIQPASPYEVVLACFKSILDYEGPVYLRLSRWMKTEIYDKNLIEFEIGKAITLRDGNDITIIATGGRPVVAAIRAVENLNKDGIKARLINMHTIKPIDKDAVLKACQETKGIVTVEEGNIAGGMGAAVNEIVTENHPSYVKMIGIPYDQFTVIGHSPDELCQYFGISADNIEKSAKEILLKV
jgi:transketolase